MREVPITAVRQALALIGVDDPENVSRVDMDHERIIVERHALRDGRAHVDDQGRLLITKDTIRIDYTKPVMDVEPGVHTVNVTTTSAAPHTQIGCRYCGGWDGTHAAHCPELNQVAPTSKGQE